MAFVTGEVEPATKPEDDARNGEIQASFVGNGEPHLLFSRRETQDTIAFLVFSNPVRNGRLDEHEKVNVIHRHQTSL